MSKKQRNRSKVHPGVSVKPQTGGKHLVRWRERVEGGKTAPRKKVIHGTPRDAELMAIEIYEAVQRTGTWVDPTPGGRKQQPVRPTIAELTDLWTAWYRYRVHTKGARGSTPKTIRGCLLAFDRGLRAVSGLPADAPLPVSLMTTANCDAVLEYLRTTPSPSPKGRTRRDGTPAKPSGNRRKPPGRSRQNQIMRYVYAAWTWAADEGDDAWPGLPNPPRAKSRVVPPVPVSSDALEAPTWQEMDILVDEARALKHPASADIGDIFTVARCLGLRIGQVIRLKVGDVRGLHRRDQPTMIRIRPELGKTKQERRGRTVPVAPVVVPTIRRLVAGKKPEDAIFEREGQINNYTLNNIVRRSIDRGVRPEVFGSLERGNKRKTHYFRAGFISGIQQLGASKKAAQRLVGHQAADTADGAYDPATLQMLIEAVALVPEITPGPDLPGKVLPLAATG